MHPSLEHLIRLQQLETDAGERKRRLADLPTRRHGRGGGRGRRQRRARCRRGRSVAENQASRRAADRELGVHQGRLTKFKDQLMEVKTNKEYTTMQHEIATAEEGVRGFEDQILTLMMQADELPRRSRRRTRRWPPRSARPARVRTEVEAERARSRRSWPGSPPRAPASRVDLARATSGCSTTGSRRGAASPSARPRRALPGLPGHRPAAADHAGAEGRRIRPLRVLHAHPLHPAPGARARGRPGSPKAIPSRRPHLAASPRPDARR